jgi:DIS3-like exonuclease 2
MLACSLNPGVDRFAFSVEWELDEQGVIHDQWFGKSVIRSCAKLAYPMVQVRHWADSVHPARVLHDAWVV